MELRLQEKYIYRGSMFTGEERLQEKYVYRRSQYEHKAPGLERTTAIGQYEKQKRNWRKSMMRIMRSRRSRRSRMTSKREKKEDQEEHDGE